MKNMKKILTITLLVLTCNLLFAQDGENELKNIRFGLKVAPSINWLKPEGNIIKGDGASVKFGGGLVLEFRLAKVISIQTGLEINTSGGKVKYNNGATLITPNSNSVSYYYNTLDEAIVKYEGAHDSTSHNHYQLNNRNYNITYITLPFGFKMKTKEIGIFTYYGHFGINNSFRWKAMAKDDVQKITATGLGTSETKSKINITKDASFYTASLNMGLGAEMNLAGSTSLTFGLNYLLGFTSIVKNDSDYLERRANNALSVPAYTKMPQQIKSNAIVLTVGVLF